MCILSSVTKRSHSFRSVPLKSSFCLAGKSTDISSDCMVAEVVHLDLW